MPSEPSAPSSKDPVPRYEAGGLIARKYLLERVVGEGGMGSVWLARNLDLDAPVAIKLVRADRGPAGMAGRLQREARVAAKVQHHAVIRVFDFGETDYGDPFIAMEHLEGMTLADALDEVGSLDGLVAVRLLLPIIDGLAAAHALGIVHRDVKPDNIVLATGARHVQPKILDFGVARLEHWDPNPRITIDGAVVGSPSYMAPEQARGKDDVDHRADVWGVCATLYEAVTGFPPFQADSYNGLLRMIIEEEVSMPEATPGPEAALWPILLRGLAKDRRARFQTMRELGAALARVLLGQGISDDVCGNSLVTVWGLGASSPAHLPAEPAPPRVPAGAALGRDTRASLRPTVSTSPLVPATPRRAWEVRAALVPLAVIVLVTLVSATRPWHAAETGAATTPSGGAGAPQPDVAPAARANAAPVRGVAVPSLAAAAPTATPAEPRARAPAHPTAPSRPRNRFSHGWPVARDAREPRAASLRVERRRPTSPPPKDLKEPYQ
jgi:eukaryotic-like serine/threonine-protein kinase